MSKQDKATIERFAKTLRELVKLPENRNCADCKRNDPRWASWNLGVFLCIRCSGIHRGMGTHISKVKSVDLDVWTPEQMESITKWGNHLANLYWEAHLKAGHIPPEHKMESFIRSKYESRRWALDGPPPTNPSILDSDAIPQPASTSAPSVAPQHQQATTTATPTPVAHKHSLSVSSRASAAPPIMTRQPVAHHQLLSTNFSNRPVGTLPTPAPASVAQQPQQPIVAAPVSSTQNDLFSLDFHAPPAPVTAPEVKKDVKQDILSLFSTPAPSAQPVFGGYNNQSANWGGLTTQQQQPQQQVPVTSMMGVNGPGIWGASSGWTPAQTQLNVWGTPAPSIPQQQQNVLNASAVWGSTTSATVPASADLFGSSFPTQPAQKKDDAFDDIWGGFK